MENEEIIKKWLDGALSEEERVLFEQREDFSMLQKISDEASSYKAPDYDVEEELARLKLKLDTTKVVSVNWTSQLLKIAASVIIVVGLIYFLSPSKSNTMVQVSSSDVSELHLPDQSLVRLNAGSFVLFNKEEWDSERKVVLNGEAYFDVTDGSVFEVQTSTGSVKVLGTSFNVKDRDGVLEVSCYSGYVSVETNDEETVLFKGQKVVVSNLSSSGKIHLTDRAPAWISGVSTFESASFFQVVNEFERQYNIDIILNDVDSTTLFTGTFTNSDMEIGLKSITLPLNLQYQITGDQVILSKAE